ncbi:RidA family protein [Actinokineospora sp. HUAS TT18]|uniref:RidA family protein n=1 Tax=Actinokineospora sp. HUAS TT18 TaxID=3447451 RepID=UPI003F525C20
MTFTLEDPPHAYAAVGRYSNVAVVDLGPTRLLVLSGQVAFDERGDLVGDDMAAQTTQIFEVAAKLLGHYGADFTDVVNIRTYLTDMAQLAEYAAVRRRYLNGRPPTSTTVEVSRLFLPGALLEVEFTAAISTGR